MKVLQIGSHAFGPPLFGEAAHVDDLVISLRADGHDITRIGIDPFALRLMLDVADRPSQRLQITVPTDSWTDADIISRTSLANTHFYQALEPLINESFEAVHLHSPFAAPAAISLARRADVPLVYTAHTVDGEMLEQERNNLVARECIYALQTYAMHSADVVIAPSAATAAEIDRRHSPNRLLTVRHSLRNIPAPKGTYAIEGRSARILFAGRLAPGKGLDLLLPAIAQLDMPAELWIAGFGPDEDSIRAGAHQLGLNVQFLGRLSRAELFLLYGQADLLVFPSLYETYGLVLREAMAAGLPVIAHDLPCLAEQIEHNRNGILVPLPRHHFDHREAWHSELHCLLTDEDTRAALGTRARETASCSDWSAYSDLYRASIAEGRRPTSRAEGLGSRQ